MSGLFAAVAGESVRGGCEGEESIFEAGGRNLKMGAETFVENHGGKPIRICHGETHQLPVPLYGVSARAPGQFLRGDAGLRIPGDGEVVALLGGNISNAPVRDDASVIHEDDSLGKVLGFLEVMGGEDNGAPAGGVGEYAPRSHGAPWHPAPRWAHRG